MNKLNQNTIIHQTVAVYDLPEAEARTLIENIPERELNYLRQCYMNTPIPISELTMKALEQRKLDERVSECPYENDDCYHLERCFECITDDLKARLYEK